MGQRRGRKKKKGTRLPKSHPLPCLTLSAFGPFRWWTEVVVLWYELFWGGWSVLLAVGGGGGGGESKLVRTNSRRAFRWPLYPI